MFTWICPKCGGEVPPAYSECPRCAPPQKAGETAAATVVAPVETTAKYEAPAAPVEAARPVVSPPAAPLSPAISPEPVHAPMPSPAAIAAPAATPRRAMSPAVVAGGAALGTVALLSLLYLYVLPHRGESTAKAETTRLETPGSKGSSARTHPYAKHLEIGGVRIAEDRSGRAKISFMVVNHSGADLPAMQMDVRIQSGGRDFFTFPVALPSIGPYEAREMSATVRTDIKPYELPDWQLIQPAVTIRTEP